MISTSTRLPLCLLQLDLLKTCLLGRYIQAFLTWRSVWYRQVASSLLSRWSLPLDHFCLRRNSRISWWNSPLTINRIFFASSHNKNQLSLAWSQHWSNMSYANKRHPDVSIVVIRLLEYMFQMCPSTIHPQGAGRVWWVKGLYLARKILVYMWQDHLDLVTVILPQPNLHRRIGSLQFYIRWTDDVWYMRDGLLCLPDL